MRRLCLAALCAVTLLVAPPAGGATGAKVTFLRGEQTIEVQRPARTLAGALTALLAGPTASERAQKVTTQIPTSVPLRGVRVAGDGTATVDLGERFAAGTAPASLDARVAQVVLTATAWPRVKRVRLLVRGGVPLGLFPGYVTRYPISRKDVVAPDAPKPEAPPGPTAPPTSSTRALQQRLADLGFLAPSGVDGRPGPQTRFAVMGFQKWERIPADGDAGPRTTAALATATRPTPRLSAPGTRAEVLLDRQLTLFVRNGFVERTLHVSSGKPGFGTPAGHFSVFRKEQSSWSVPYKVWLPWASYFVGGVAFHEYADVPPYPASHGCVRVPPYDAHWLYDQLPIGTRVDVLARS